MVRTFLLRGLLLIAPALLLPHVMEAQAMSAQASVTIAGLRCEDLVDPLGIDATAPRLSWQLRSRQRGDRQSAYQILVASRKGLLNEQGADIWNTGKVARDQSVHLPYGGPALASGKAYYWKVRVWNRDGVASAWSAAALWTMGLLAENDWMGKWIGLDVPDRPFPLAGAEWIWYPEGDPQKEAPVGTRYFRRSVMIPPGATVTGARLFGTGDNECTIYLNGDEVLTSKQFRVIGEADVKSRLRPGLNIIGASVVNTGEKPTPAGFIGRLAVEYGDGTSLFVPSGRGWKSSAIDVVGWRTGEFNDSGWVASKVLGPAGMQPWGDLHTSDDRRLPARWLRKEFTLEKKVARATAYLSGLGLSELYVNGKKIGTDVLSPALSEYSKRIFYITHDVTDALRKGRNAVGVVLGNGRYFAPRVHEPTLTRTYGSPKLLLELRLEFSDGTVRRLVSDESWKLTAAGPIRANNEYDGEDYDARMELAGWAEPGYAGAGWQPAERVAPPDGKLRAQMIPPIRVTGNLKPVSVKELKPGVFIFDMGQNMVGWCRLRVSGPAGTKIALRHAETLRPDGELYVDNIRSAKVTDTYTLKGKGKEVYEPRFTYHGFRFVEMRGYPGRPDVSALEGRVVNDDVDSAGEFSCSNTVINRIYRNIVWGVRGNYRSIPTDCPQRDERQGWLGDRSAESRGETFLFDIAPLYGKWLQDMADAQNESGSVSDVCPSYWPLYNDNVTWPSSTVIIPATLLEQYGDSGVVARHYPSMVRWIDYMTRFIEDGIITKDSYGDWCVPPEDPKLILSNDPLRKTAPGILATSYFCHDLALMARYASLLGNDADRERFAALGKKLGEGLNRKFFDAGRGYYDNGSQTSCVLPLAFDLVPPEMREGVFRHLVDKITNETRMHVGTGLVGGQWLNRVLSRFGRPDIAYALAANTTYPSWGYMAEKGATTIWELWNGDTADPSMNSGNHVMLVGDLVIWLYENVSGIRSDPEHPGFRRLVMRPTPVGDLSTVKATHKSPYGLIASEWTRGKKDFEWKISIPVNSTATVYVPAKDAGSVAEKGKPVRGASGVSFLRMEGGYAVFDVASGNYQFTSVIP